MAGFWQIFDKWEYRIFGMWYRYQACRLAAKIMAHRTDLEPRLVQSYAVFFEQYLLTGANGTAEFFGADVVKLHAVERDE